MSDAWLSQVKEEVEDPHRIICDAHHHLWHYPHRDVPLKYMLDDLLADVAEQSDGGGHQVVSTVYAECGSMYRVDGPIERRSVGETEFVSGVAAMCDSGVYKNPVNNLTTRVGLGIVGCVDLCAAEATGELLDEHMATSARFKGIRHATAWDADERIRNSHTHPRERLLEDVQFRTGLAQLAPRGLSFDAWLYHPQIQELTTLAQDFSDTCIVFDHFGGPLGIGPYKNRRAELFARWKKDVWALAQCPNVVAKLGGLIMPINGFGLHKQNVPPTSDALVDLTRDYYLHMIDCFGAERCMFESNFPVDRQSCSYHVLWNAFKKLVADFSETDKNNLFHDTAQRVYRLNQST